MTNHNTPPPPPPRPFVWEAAMAPSAGQFVQRYDEAVTAGTPLRQRRRSLQQFLETTLP